MNITSATATSTDDDDHHGPPQFASFPESAFTFGSVGGGGVGGVAYGTTTTTATLRRVKPLPRSKRRRMSDEEAGLLTPADVVALQQQGVTTGPNPNAATAFPYGASGGVAWSGSSMPGGYPAGFAFDLSGGGYQQGGGGGASEDYFQAGNDDDGAGHDGSGRDRGDQQGNTKKRKVPAVAHHGHFRGSSSDDGDAAGGGGVGGDDQLDRRGEPDTAGMGGSGAAASGTMGSGGMNDAGVMEGKPRLSISTATGIKLKEITRIRKRLLSSVLGPASSPSSAPSTTTAATTGDGENLALDIALSAPLKWPPQVSLPTTTEPLASTARRQRKRISERRKKQRATSTSESRCALPSGEFTLEIASESSERMKTTNAEITSYRVKFAQELARISAKQAEAAKKAATAAANAKLSSGTMTKKLSDGSKAGSSPGGGAGSRITADGGSSTSKKKKKRSTKANDPHQIRNYIPSRLPGGTGVPQPPTAAQAAQNLKSLISPHPVQFLAAEPKRRSKKSNKEKAKPTVTSSLPPVQPADEWICGFCEFNLFYGDDSALRRAVRARKSLLTRRRRARERAAAAASGQGKLLAAAKKGDESDEEDLPEEEQEAKFVDPAEVDARVAASMGNASRKPVVRDKIGGAPPGSGGIAAAESTTVSGTAKA